VSSPGSSAVGSSDDALAYAGTIPDSIDGKAVTKTTGRYSDPGVVDAGDPGGVGKMVAQFGKTLDDFTFVQARTDDGIVVISATRLPGVDAKSWTKVLDEVAFAQGMPSPIATESIEGRDVVVYDFGANVVLQYDKGDVSYRVMGATKEEAARRLALLP
jgi:hypothetical protein